MTLVETARRLAAEADALRFAAPVAFVYNPLQYAWEPHRTYLERFGAGPKEAVLLGMNPGPFGMAQTGVPFGEVGLVRDWMGIEAPVGRPPQEHPRRPVQGFACPRSEVSGRRLWGWARERYPRAEDFFARFLVLNYCPLAFLEESGRNRTPDKLPVAERAALFSACDRALHATIAEIRPRFVIGVGKFARKRAEAALADLNVVFADVLHPSPASPAANRGWAPAAEAALTALGIRLPSPRAAGKP